MKARKVNEYVQLGITINYLRFLSEGFPVHGNGGTIDMINRFFECLDKFELKVSNRISYARDLWKIKEELEQTDESYTTSKEDAERLNENMHAFVHTINAETAELEAYIITEKRINVNKLLNDVESLMAPNVFNELNSIVQYDFQEAGKCIALERSTAAAFHSLRGIEGTLRMFFQRITQNQNLNWNEMVLQLRRHTSPPPDEILDNLDSIRRNYRNPTAHPEKIYDIDEVQDLFNQSTAVINQMINYLKDSNLI